MEDAANAAREKVRSVFLLEDLDRRLPGAVARRDSLHAQRPKLLRDGLDFHGRCLKQVESAHDQVDLLSTDLPNTANYLDDSGMGAAGDDNEAFISCNDQRLLA